MGKSYGMLIIIPQGCFEKTKSQPGLVINMRHSRMMARFWVFQWVDIKLENRGKRSRSKMRIND